MGKITVLIPFIFVLDIIWHLGEMRPSYIINGEHVVMAIIVFFGIWIMGYIGGMVDGGSW